VTVGDFETFVARDLVAHIDAHYRTIADRRSRGLAGHSMGGYGTARIGMKHLDVFGALYMMSPCCLSTRALGTPDATTEATLRALKSPADSASLSWGQRAQLATAAAWSPNPKAPPLYLDLPIKDGQPQPDVLARWSANAPLAMLDQYAANLKRYAAIGIDVGDRDGLKDDAEKLHAGLDRYGIANSFQVYQGDHTSGVAGRVQDHMLPFFSRALAFAR
jgi:enterochelin esterase-like enzyme